MKEIRIRKYNIIFFLIISINFLVSIPLFIYGIIKRKISALNVGIFFALLHSKFHPLNNGFDIRRYLNLIRNSKLYLEYFNVSNKDYYVKYIIKLINGFNFREESLVFITSFLGYFFLYKSFLISNKKNSSGKMFFLIIFSIPLLFFSGIRFFLGMNIFLYGIVLLLLKRNYKGIVYIVISIFIHNSLLILIVLSFLTIILKKPMIKYRIYTLSVVLFFFFDRIKLDEYLIELVNSFNKLIGKVYFYPEGYLSEGYKYTVSNFKNLNIVGYVFSYFMLYLRKMVLVLYIVIADKKYINNFIYLVTIILLFLQRYLVIFERYYILVSILILFIINCTYSKNKKLKYVILNIIIYDFFNYLYDFKYFFYWLVYDYKDIYKYSLLSFILGIN